MATVTLASRPTAGDRVVALSPPGFIAWANGEMSHALSYTGQRLRLAPPWQPGQHFALLGKTREGKTNFAVWILSECRKFVLAMDPKGGDESLAASGWPRVTAVPPHEPLPPAIERLLDQAREAERTGQYVPPVRIIVGLENTRSRAADVRNRQLMAQAIEYARQAGCYALYVDEHQILSDQRMFNLGSDIARMAISAARDGTSVVTSTQYLAWIEKAATRQATLIALWRTKNRDMVKLAADQAGRDWRDIAAIVDELPKYHVLVIPDELRAPMMIVKPPKVT